MRPTGACRAVHKASDLEDVSSLQSDGMQMFLTNMGKAA